MPHRSTPHRGTPHHDPSRRDTPSPAAPHAGALLAAPPALPRQPLPARTSPFAALWAPGPDSVREAFREAVQVTVDVLSSGLEQQARRNAWAATSQGAVRAHARRVAEAAVREAALREADLGEADLGETDLRAEGLRAAPDPLDPLDPYCALGDGLVPEARTGE